MYNSVYIFGLGMMGGSLASSIKNKKLAKKIYAYDKNLNSLKYSKDKKLINDYDNKDFKYLSESDLIIICAPMNAYKSIFNTIKKYKKSSAIITDIGSTKQNIINILKLIIVDHEECFIGSHPLTGKETSMVMSYEKNLFDKAVVLITPTEKTKKILVNKVSKFWRAMKCKVTTISPELHDALVNIILNTKSIKNIKDYTGGGFKDFARLAHSDGIMWGDICSTNEKNIITSINMLIKELNLIKKMVKVNNKSLRLYLNGIKAKLDKK
jgi:prephenate dehydrogenase